MDRETLPAEVAIPSSDERFRELFQYAPVGYLLQHGGHVSRCQCGTEIDASGNALACGTLCTGARYETALVYEKDGWTAFVFILPPDGLCLPAFAKIENGIAIEWTTKTPDCWRGAVPGINLCSPETPSAISSQ